METTQARKRLSLVQAELSARWNEKLRDRYWHRPDLFAEECIKWSGGGPAPYQVEAWQQLPTVRRYAVRGPHGLGKTTIMAIVLLWFAITRDGRKDWKVITTASVWRQLSNYLWPEVHKWSRLLNWTVIGRLPFDDGQELLDTALKLQTGAASAVSPDRPEFIEGAHAEEILYIFDEAKVIPRDTWTAAEGAFANGECYALAGSTPALPEGQFYDIHQRKPGLEEWKVRHVTRDEAIAAGRLSPDWCEKRARQWGINSAVYQNRVLGEFAESSDDGVIPLSWVEAAMTHHLEVTDWGQLIALGVDVGRGGDKSVIAHRHEAGIRELQADDGADTMHTTGLVAGQMGDGRAVVDVVGIGAGVLDRLVEQGRDAHPFNAGERSDRRDSADLLEFADRRSEAWWGLRELLDPANEYNVTLPNDDELTGDLTAPKWGMTSSGKVKVESKDTISKRLGRSTDKGDAVVQAFWEPSHEPEFVFI